MPTISRRRLMGAGALALLALLGAGCSPAATSVAEARSSRPRRSAADAPAEDVGALVVGLHQFSLDLFRRLRSGQESIFFSPYSVLAAMSMLAAGARGATAAQMFAAMRLGGLPAERLHPAMNALSLGLTPGAGAEGTFTLSIVNELWAQQGLPIQTAYLDTLAESYGAGLRLLDFVNSAEPARAAINARISEATKGLIPELLGPGMITALTRLVITNAIYFKAKWLSPFTHDSTSDATFTTLAGEQIAVPMMRKRTYLSYAEGEGYQAVELPYRGSAAMLAILPAPDGLTALEDRLDGAQIQAIIAALADREVVLSLPRVKLQPSPFSLRQALADMGMADAFNPAAADFSGIDGARDLSISDGIHQATLLVDEEGTEAAAATAFGAVGAGLPVEPPVELHFNRPFLVLIRDSASGAPLFFGRVASPRG